MREILAAVVLFLGFVVFTVSCTFLQGTASTLAREEGPQFDHAAHMEKGLECAFCHGEEEQGWNAMPTLETCNECHAEIDPEAPPEKRATIFFDEQGGGRWVHATKVNPEVIFDHAAHVRTHEDCNVCHADVAAATAVPRSAAFTMQECMDCHSRTPEGQAHNECASCHREIRQDRAPPSHAAGWRERHGRLLPDRSCETIPDDCTLCHTRTDCDTCHRAEMPRSHTHLFRQHGHAAMASIDRDSCRACHTTDSCFLCHQDALPRSHRGTWGPPFDRHCISCHLPVDRFDDQGCAVCHRGATHETAPPRPNNPVHMTTNPNACRECHTPLPHPDNGQTCLFCHR